MATRLKNSFYSPLTKALIIILMIAGAGLFIVNLVWVASISSDLEEKSYFGTHDFQREIGRLAHNVVEKHVGVPDEDIMSYQGSDKSSERIYRLQDIESNLARATSFVYLLEEIESGKRYTNIEQKDPVKYLEGLNVGYFYEGNTMGLLEHSREYHRDNVFAKNRGESVSYYNGDSILRILSGEISKTITNAKDSEEEVATNTSYRLYVGIENELKSTDQFFYNSMKHFNYVHWNLNLFMAKIVGSAIVLMVGAILLCFLSGRKSVEGKAELAGYDKIPFEIQLGFIGILFIPLILFMNYIDYDLIFEGENLRNFTILVELIFIGVLLSYTSFIRLVKNKALIKNTITGKIVLWIFGFIKKFWHQFKGLFDFLRLPVADRHYKLKVVGWVTGYLFLNLVGFMLMMDDSLIGLILLILTNCFIVYEVIKFAKDFYIITNTVHKKRLGQDTDQISVEDISKNLQEFYRDIETLQEGLDNAVNERLKGERLKAELITNVTHDLKNPLTSIISYVELIKQKELYDDEVNKYIEVLAEKSYRLKGLIEQLVEASKASTGNISVEMTSVDIVELSRQLCGEYDEIMAEADLKCVFANGDSDSGQDLTVAPNRFMVEADGMVLYRIIDNLMSNVCKYSLRGTRVYIDIEEVGEKIHYNIKNISKEPLNMDVEDLSRRFVRGDSSRNTEGSGLGLSIALSLAKLIGAELRLIIDGDLFKATLIMNK